jgi:ubiquinone/menaquinone biosynthesis C-methylase UbiE
MMTLRRSTSSISEVGKQLWISPGNSICSAGCASSTLAADLGGASRYFAQEHDCQVCGVDITGEYVRVARMLSCQIGLTDRVSYQQASALSLPFAEGFFDGAYMLHVGMNIADKRKLFAEVRRVLKTGAVFGIYDVMRESDGAFCYPVPWSETPETNFIEPAEIYKQLLAYTGFVVTKERSRRDFAAEFFRQMREHMMQNDTSPLGLQILMGATAPQKVANMIRLIDSGIVAPREIISRAM